MTATHDHVESLRLRSLRAEEAHRAAIALFARGVVDWASVMAAKAEVDDARAAYFKARKAARE